MKKWVCLLGALLAVHLAVLVVALLLGGGAFETGAVGESHGKETEEKSLGTEESTTAESTTTVLQTEEPTASGPTTTAAPTTEAATTAEAVTAAPTVSEPTTTTEAATTEPPTTEPVTTVAPTTEAATTEPTTAAPVIDIPDGSGLYQVLTMTEQEALARGKVIYLTFDDGPGPYTPKLLEILNKYNVKVTFFVTGGYPEWYHMMKEAKEDGHTIGTHTYFHHYADIYSHEDNYFADLKKIEDVIYQQIGEVPKLIRFPGGSSNQTSKQYNIGIMTRLTAEMESRGYHYFDWNVDSDDAGSTRTTEGVLQNVINGIKRHSVSVVLQHDLHEYSVDAVEDIIIWGLSNGYVFLPITMETPVVHHGVAN